ncbi:sulfite exporter TauE/SafE family protein [Palaeococcus ferrophilus]|uniref:sulfite exporter TauE/SafE family protein n=1 Tax=Palaeococcus ferrophilus TaxID=83868 RepID=UPI00064FA976|nr:sulfite exporter TauE/SafE family protein [Palaeococcus ferrophilus]
MLEYPVIFIAGLLIGTIAGLFGVGGGFLIVPLLVIMGFPIHTAIGTSLLCISISSLAAAYNHVRAKRVLYRVALLKEAFSVPAALGGAYLSRMVGENHLRAVFALLLVYLAYRFLRAQDVKPGEWEGEIKYRNVPIVGLFSGFFSGLLGISGGILNVPLFHALVRIPVKYAVGTSSLALFFTALAGTLGHYRLGHVDVSTALLLAPGLVIGASIGVHALHRLHPQKFKWAFSLLLLLMALKMIL